MNVQFPPHDTSHLQPQMPHVAAPGKTSIQAESLQARIANVLETLQASSLHHANQAHAQQLRTLSLQGANSSTTASHMRWFAALACTITSVGGVGALSTLFMRNLSQQTQQTLSTIFLNVMPSFATLTRECGEADRTTLQMMRAHLDHQLSSEASAKSFLHELENRVNALYRTIPISVNAN